MINAKNALIEKYQFTEEQKQLIPNLGEEFELPEQLKPICNAVVNGDSKTVHGFLQYGSISPGNLS